MKHLFSILFLISCSFRFADSQPNTFFKIYYTSPQILSFSSVLQRSDNKYLVVYPGYGGTPLKSDRIYLMDINGDTISSKSFCSLYGTSIIHVKDSNYLFVSSTFPPNCYSSISWLDMKVIKIDFDLDTIWTKAYPSPSNSFEQGQCIRELKDGNYIFCGTQDFADNLYKIDTAGNVIWQRFIVMDAVRSVIEDYDGNLVMVGEIYGPLNSWSVIKTDSSGQNVLWAKYYGNTGGLGDAGFHDIVLLPDSNYLLGGNCDLTPVFKFMKIDKSTGDSIWSDYTYGTIRSMDKAVNGKIAAIGLSPSSSSNLYMLNDTGGVIWSKFINNVSMYCVRFTNDGGLIVAGAAGTTQAYPFLMKTDSLGNFATGIEDLNIQVLNYSIVPNPVTEQSRLLFGNPRGEEHEFVLFDIAGRESERQRTRGSSITLSRTNHTAGMYIFRLSNTVTGEVMNGKVVME